MKNILAGSGSGHSGCGNACMYYVSGSWTGKLVGCHDRIIGVPPYQTSTEVCVYEAYDPHGVGYTGSEVINGAVARQC